MVEKNVCVAQPLTVSHFPPVSSPVLEQVLSARGLVYAQISWLRNGCWTPEVAWKCHKAQTQPAQTIPGSSVYSRTQLNLLLRKIVPCFLFLFWFDRDSSFILITRRHFFLFNFIFLCLEIEWVRITILISDTFPDTKSSSERMEFVCLSVCVLLRGANRMRQVQIRS